MLFSNSLQVLLTEIYVVAKILLIVNNCHDKLYTILNSIQVLPTEICIIAKIARTVNNCHDKLYAILKFFASFAG